MYTIESKITKSVSYQFVNLLITGLAGVFFIPFIISSLGKEQYGIFEIAYSLNIINSVLDIGIGTTITNYAKKYFDLDKKKFAEFFWTFFWFKVLLSIIGLVICILLSYNVDSIFRKVSLENAQILKLVIIWFGIGVLIESLNSFLSGVVNGFVRFDITSFAGISSKVFYVLGFFIWYYIGEFTLVSFSILSFVLVPLVKLITQLLQVYIYVPEVVSTPKMPRLFYIKDTLNYLGGISFVTISAQLFNYGTQALLSIVASPVIVGEFGILQRILRLVKQISSMLVRPVMPAAQDLKKKYSIVKIITLGTNIHSIAVIGITFMVLINSDIISKYYLHSEFPNFSLHLIIMGVQMLIPSFAVMLMLYYNEGKSEMSVQFNILNTIISIALAYIGLGYFGFIGYISGLTIGYTICTSIQLIRYLKYYNILFIDFYKIYIKRYMTIIVGLLIYCAISILFGQSVLHIVFWNVLIVTIFTVLSWLDLSVGTKKLLINIRK
jgi:O-antigen/teichoic acid export membrane protein